MASLHSRPSRRVATLTCVALAVLGSTSAGAVARTRVVHWSPFTASGALRSGLHATPAYGGTCWTGSFVLHGGYRCMDGNRIHDPCFSDPTRDDAVLCVSDPFTHHAVRLRVSGSMDGSGSARSGTVWAVRLAGGQKCVFFAGGATAADGGGRRMNYGCGHSTYLWGNPVRGHRTWRIRLTHSFRPDGERLVAIRTAYIGEN